VLREVRYVQPVLDPDRRGSEDEMFLMFYPVEAGTQSLPREEVIQILDFIYLRWYRDPYSNDAKYVERLHELARLVKKRLPRRVKLVALRYHGYPGGRPWNILVGLYTMASVSLGFLYKTGPLKSVLDSQSERLGHVLLFVLALAVGLVHWLVERYKKEYQR
jgi:hypothetical protein